MQSLAEPPPGSIQNPTFSHSEGTECCWAIDPRVIAARVKFNYRRTTVWARTAEWAIQQLVEFLAAEATTVTAQTFTFPAVSKTKTIRSILDSLRSIWSPLLSRTQFHP